jgi:ATP-dependent Lon protease
MGLVLTPDDNARLQDVALYDREEVEARLRLFAEPDEFVASPFSDSAFSDQLRRLRALLADPRGPCRPTLSATRDMLCQLDALSEDAPNFATATQILSRSARLSQLTSSPVVVRPILLVGEPGIGKTRFAKRCAAALGSTFAEYSFAQADDIGQLLGHSIAWRGAQIGLLTRTLIGASNASPLILLDEIDKAPQGHNGVPLDALHTLLEPATAQDFVDPYFEIKVCADGVIWIATANDISAVKSSLLDRFVIVHVNPPTSAQEVHVIRAIYAEIIAHHASGFAADLNDDALPIIRGHAPRVAKRILEFALGFAAEDGRLALSATDIVRAQRLASPATKSEFGFHARR